MMSKSSFGAAAKQNLHIPCIVFDFLGIVLSAYLIKNQKLLLKAWLQSRLAGLWQLNLHLFTALCVWFTATVQSSFYLQQPSQPTRVTQSRDSSLFPPAVQFILYMSNDLVQHFIDSFSSETGGNDQRSLCSSLTSGPCGVFFVLQDGLKFHPG